MPNLKSDISNRRPETPHLASEIPASRMPRRNRYPVGNASSQPGARILLAQHTRVKTQRASSCNAQPAAISRIVCPVAWPAGIFIAKRDDGTGRLLEL
jgi:hypothetical protein